MLQTLKLRPREDKRLRQGHVWIYSNEVDTHATPLKAFEPGEEVVVLTAGGKPLGRALVNPHVLICGRLVSRDPDVGLDGELIGQRIDAALAIRERLYPGTGCYRLVFGEADGLSGLVIDRYGDVAVVQLTTAGMELRRDLVVDALRARIDLKSIVFKNDGGNRDAEDLEKYQEVVGADPGSRMPLLENGVSFQAPLTEGQKTGWYYDHRENRARMAPMCGGSRVLDAFCYVGGWGLQALAFGAESVTMVDSSTPALEMMQSNAAMQGVGDRVRIERGDGFDTLAGLADAGEHYDVVVIDPPGLIKRRRDIRAGQRAYERLARSAMRLVSDNGLVVFASCSLHFQRDMLRDTVRAAARHTDRQIRMLGLHGAGPDHPVHPAIPETDYLKAAFLQVRHAPRGGAM